MTSIFQQFHPFDQTVRHKCFINWSLFHRVHHFFINLSPITRVIPHLLALKRNRLIVHKGHDKEHKLNNCMIAMLSVKCAITLGLNLSQISLNTPVFNGITYIFASVEVNKPFTFRWMGEKNSTRFYFIFCVQIFVKFKTFIAVKRIT